MGKKFKEKPGDKRKKAPPPDTLIYRLWLKAKGAEQEAEENPTAEPQAVEEPLPELPAGSDNLSCLWCQWGAKRRGVSGYNLLEFLADDVLNENCCEDIRLFEERLNRDAGGLLFRGEEQQDTPLDAFARVQISSDLITAWAFVFPPQHGGREIDEEIIRDRLQYRGVVYGINDEVVAKLASGRFYFRIMTIARGVARQDGTNGALVDSLFFEARRRAQFNGDTQPDAKFACMVQKGTTICTITPPTDAVDGINVKGARVKGIPGKPLQIPRIPNTELSPDGKTLIASTNGRVEFSNNKYILEKMLTIDSDVDISVGNLEFDGDILITGDVRDGFRVQATGSIEISGMVENATVIAGGTITIGKGMNGNGEGRLEAQKEIRSRYLENCSVWAGGCIYAENIICSDIASDCAIYALEGKGVIIGGSCTALEAIKAVCIGTKSHRTTVVALGCTSNLLQKVMQAEESLRALQAELEQTVKDLRYLEATRGDISEERKAKMNTLRLSRSVLLMKEKQLLHQFSKLSREVANGDKGRIECECVYPNTKIVIGEASMSVYETQQHCMIYSADSEIVIGSL